MRKKDEVKQSRKAREIKNEPFIPHTNLAPVTTFNSTIPFYKAAFQLLQIQFLPVSLPVTTPSKQPRKSTIITTE